MKDFFRHRILRLLLIVLTVIPVLGQDQRQPRQDQIQPVSGLPAVAIDLLLAENLPFTFQPPSSAAGLCNTSQLADGSQIATQLLDVSKPVYDPIAANSSESVLWPGALVQLKPLMDTGILSGIPVARTGGKVFLKSLAATVDQTGRPVTIDADITQFGAAAVEAARISLLSNPAVVGTGQFSSGFASFNSLNELAFKFNGSASAFGASFATQLNSDEYHQQNNEAILFYQPIYTYATEDLPRASAFADGVTSQMLSPYTSRSNPIGYISSVSYGRMAVMTFSSSLDKAELDTLVRASAGFLLGGRADAETERRVRRAVTQTNIRIWVYGFAITNNDINSSADKIAALKAAMGESGPMVLRSALPLFYRVNYLFNNQAVAIKLSTQFSTSTRTGPPLVEKVKVRFRMGNDPGDNKDWNTALNIYLLDRMNSISEYLPGHIRANTSVPRGVNGEGSWQSGREFEVELSIVGKLEWSKLNTMTLLVTEEADGADHIAFTPTVIAEGPSGANYRSTLQGFSIPSSNVPGWNYSVPFPGMFGQVTTAVPLLPAPSCESPQNLLRSVRTASSR